MVSPMMSVSGVTPTIPLRLVKGGVPSLFVRSSAGTLASVPPLPAIGQTVPTTDGKLDCFTSTLVMWESMFGVQDVLCQLGYWSDRLLKLEPPVTSR